MVFRSLLLVLVLALLVGGYFLFGNPDSEAAAGGAAAPGSDPGPVEAAAPGASGLEAATLTSAEAGEPSSSEQAPQESVAVRTESTTGPAPGEASLPALLVRVVDGAGQPRPGIDVVLESSSGDVLARAESAAPGGIARFEGSALALPGSEEPGEARLHVRAETLLEEAVTEEVDPTALGPHPLELVLPIHGSVVVVLTEVDGEPYEAPGFVRIGLVRDDEAMDVGTFGERRKTSMKAEIRNGRASFPVVALGSLLELRVSRPDSQVETALTSAGPTSSRQPLEIPLQWGSDHPVLRFRVVGEDGRALASSNLEVETSVDFSGFADHSRSSIQTNADGRVQIDLSNNWTAESERFLKLEGMGANGGEALYARLDLSHALGPGLHERGDVVLAPPPVFVAGRVVDTSGEGAGGAVLELEVAGDPNEGGVTGWTRQHEFQLKAGEDGTFRALGFESGTRFRLTAKSEGLIGTTVEFEPGAKDIVLELLPGGVLDGLVLVDEGIPAGQLSVTLMPQPRKVDPNARRTIEPTYTSGSVRDNGTFGMTGLAPGIYTLRIANKPTSSTLMSLKDVEVRAGEEVSDPRIDPIDLRGLLFVHVVTLVPPDGTEEVTGNLRFGPEGQDPPGEHTWVRSLTHEIVSMSARIDVVFESTGMRVARAYGVSKAVELKLVAAPRVRLRIEGSYDPPEPPYFVRPVLVPVGAPPSFAFDWDSPALDSRREVVVPAQEVGTCEVRWLVQRLGSSVGVGRVVDSLGHQVEVADSEGEQVLTIELTQEQLDQLLSEFP